jgi:uncharacterized membrane protein YoaK (UPF0700 family)
LIQQALSAPYLTWALIGFSLSYFFFFLHPVLFSAPAMQFFQYLPAIDPVGADLKNTLRTAHSLFTAGQNPYIDNNQYAYPPFASILVVPLLLTDPSSAYKIVTLATVLCYLMVTLALPLWLGGDKQVTPLSILFFTTGLFSYGFQFELERGQFNVIAIFLCLLAIWIYHQHERLRILGYALFTISVQLKVFPLIFLLMFVRDWRDWSGNLRRNSALVAANLALLFVLGPGLFVDFVNAIGEHTENPVIWAGNHSVRSFVTLYSRLLAGHGLAWAERFSGPTQTVLLAVILICIASIVLRTGRENRGGISPLLLLACAIGALLIPSASHDYTLSILAAPMAILFSNGEFPARDCDPRRQLNFILWLTVFFGAYSSTLFSPTNKPPLLMNNFPSLLIMLVMIAFLSSGRGRRAPTKAGKEAVRRRSPRPNPRHQRCGWIEPNRLAQGRPGRGHPLRDQRRPAVDRRRTYFFFAYPSCFNACGSSRQSLSTFTRSSRYTLRPLICSISRRAALPIDFSIFPPWPITIPFCDSRSTKTVAAR